jgi:hypothetical protein
LNEESGLILTLSMFSIDLEFPEWNGMGLLHMQDVAKVVQEKYIDRAEGDVNFNLITLGAVGEQ